MTESRDVSLQLIGKPSMPSDLDELVAAVQSLTRLGRPALQAAQIRGGRSRRPGSWKRQPASPPGNP